MSVFQSVGKILRKGREFIVWNKWLKIFKDIHKNVNGRNNEKKLFHGRNFCGITFPLLWYSNNLPVARMPGCFSRVWLCDTQPMDCSPPHSSVHGILQARILEWVAMPFSRGSSWPRDRTHVSYVSCIGRQVLNHWCHLGSPEIT